jgi:hypothetical protein
VGIVDAQRNESDQQIKATGTNALLCEVRLWQSRNRWETEDPSSDNAGLASNRPDLPIAVCISHGNVLWAVVVS